MSEKVGAKFPTTIPSCSMVNIGHLDGASKPSKRSIVAAKTKENKKNERGKNPKIYNPKDVGHLLKILTSVHAQHVAKCNSSGQKG